MVSSSDEDDSRLEGMFACCEWKACRVCTCEEMVEFVQKNLPPIVICERDLPDGNWKDVLDSLAVSPNPPLLIVASRLADEALWAEVLNLGGYDVLLKPFRAEEVLWMVKLAWARWNQRLNQPRRDSGTSVR